MLTVKVKNNFKKWTEKLNSSPEKNTTHNSNKFYMLLSKKKWLRKLQNSYLYQRESEV